MYPYFFLHPQLRSHLHLHLTNDIHTPFPPLYVLPLTSCPFLYIFDYCLEVTNTSYFINTGPAIPHKYQSCITRSFLPYKHGPCFTFLSVFSFFVNFWACTLHCLQHFTLLIALWEGTSFYFEFSVCLFWYETKREQHSQKKHLIVAITLTMQ